MKKSKTAVIDVGGGMRGIYAAGVLDYCLEQGITFDLGIGVSAGSANIASFTAGQHRRNYQFYMEYAMRKEYMSLRNFAKYKSYINLDYIYGTLSNSDGESPLDYEAILANPMEMQVVATDGYTGLAKYFDKGDMSQDCYDIFKASSAIPYVCRPWEIEGIPYYDGGLSDPIPVRRALKWGCDKIVVILTLPAMTILEPGKDLFMAEKIEEEFPHAAEKMRYRADEYNRSINFARKCAKEGTVKIIAPDDTCGVDTLTRDSLKLSQLYEKGRRDGAEIKDFIYGIPDKP